MGRLFWNRTLRRESPPSHATFPFGDNAACSCVDARATSVDPGSESGTDSNVESDLGQSTRSDDVVYVHIYLAGF
jgi:hypothetical protein